MLSIFCDSYQFFLSFFSCHHFMSSFRVNFFVSIFRVIFSSQFFLSIFPGIFSSHFFESIFRIIFSCHFFMSFILCHFFRVIFFQRIFIFLVNSVMTWEKLFKLTNRLKFCRFVFFYHQNGWKEPKMTVFIILREAFLKNDNIGVIKSLKLMSFNCKNNLRKCCCSGLTFRFEFDPSLF